MYLTDAEWQVMECLWDKGGLTGREAVCLLQEKMGWSRSTTLTLLRRLESKNARFLSLKIRFLLDLKKQSGLKSFCEREKTR